MADAESIGELLNQVSEATFESEKDIDVLTEYLKGVTGEEVSLAYFSEAQIQALIKIMGIDKMYLEPSDDVSEKENICKNMVKIATKLSRGKGKGMDALRDMALSRSKLSESNEVLKSQSEKGSSENED